MPTVTAAASGPALGPSLAMIREPTPQRYSQRVRDQNQPSTKENQIEMLPEPSPPPHPEQLELKSPPAPATKPVIGLVQGKSTLSSYLQIAGSQYQETPSDEEEDFVNAFVHGLRDKRDRKKCERRFKEAARTWEHVKDCFPVASQHPQSHSKKQGRVRNMEKRKAQETETGDMRDAFPKLPSAEERREVEAGERPHRLPTLAPAPEVEQDTRGVEKARLPPIPGAAKRTLVELDGQTGTPQEAAPPAGNKRRTTKKGGRRQGRPPSIPILPSSDDEFSRGCRK